MRKKFKIEFYNATNELIDCERYDTEPTYQDYIKLATEFNSARGDVYTFNEADEDDTIRYEYTII